MIWRHAGPKNPIRGTDASGLSKDLITVALLQAQKQNVALTDDCSAVEHLGVKVHLVPGSEENLKITTPLDLVVAQAVFDRRNTL